MADMRGRFEVHTLPNGTEVFYDPKPHRYYGEIQLKKKPEPGDEYSYIQKSSLVGCSTPGKTFDTDTDGLLWWAAKLERVGISELAIQALDENWPLDFLRDPDELRRMLTANELQWVDVRDRAAWRGTNVHELVFGGEHPDLSKLSDDERGLGKAALRWLVDRKPKILQAECVTACVPLRVAGRFDLRCVIDGKTWLVDAKTRAKPDTRRTDHIQLAGYELCNQWCGIGESDFQVPLILNPDGTYHEHLGVATPDDFKQAVKTYRASQDLDKRITKSIKEELPWQQ